jgi:hypothetical protein
MMATEMNPNTSAIPPGRIVLADLPNEDGPVTLTVRLTNHAKRVYVSKLAELGLFNLVAKFESQRREGESTASLSARAGSQFTIEQSSNNIAALLYAMTRYDHPDLSFRDIQAAIPFEGEAFGALSQQLMNVYGASMPEPKPKAETAEQNPPEPITSRPAKKKAAGTKRSKSS